jgi:metallo-beta-lactamase family protein
LHHLIHSIQDPDNMIIFVGFQAQATLGRRIVEGISPVSIFGDRYEVRARVHFLGGFSAHADGTELLDYVKGMTGARLRRVFLVHGEPEQALALAEQISSWNGRIKVEIPQALTEAILA